MKFSQTFLFSLIQSYAGSGKHTLVDHQIIPEQLISDKAICESAALLISITHFH